MADSTSSRDEQPRARIMPGAEHQPAKGSAGKALWGGQLAGFGGGEQIERGEQHGSGDRGGKDDKPDRHLAANLTAAKNSMAAARRQNRLCWAKAPNRAPITAPPIKRHPFVAEPVGKQLKFHRTMSFCLKNIPIAGTGIDLSQDKRQIFKKNTYVEENNDIA